MRQLADSQRRHGQTGRLSEEAWSDWQTVRKSSQVKQSYSKTVRQSFETQPDTQTDFGDMVRQSDSEK